MHIVVLILLAFVAGYFFNRYLVNRTSTQQPSADPPLSEFEALVTEGQFDTMVLETSRESPVLVDFFASWCAPCHHLGPRLAEFARDYAGAFLLAKVDVDREKELAAKYQVQSMPTVLLFKNGKAVDRFVGAVGDHAIRFFLAKHGVQPPDEMA